MAAARTCGVIALLGFARASSSSGNGSLTTTTTGGLGQRQSQAEAFLAAWPTLAGTCNTATFASFPTSGQAGPAGADGAGSLEVWRLSWSLGGETPGAALAPLQSTLAEASENGRRTLVLGPEVLEGVYSAAKASPERFRHGASVLLEIRLVTRDPQGASAAASASLELRDAEPPPGIAAAGQGGDVRAREDERITLAVRTSEVAPSCSASSRKVGILWEYTRPGLGAWVPLEGVELGGRALVDEAKPQNEVSFPPLSFEQGSRHMLRATAFYEGDPQVRWPRPSVVFRLAVTERKPPEARVKGPSHAFLQCDFALDASSSTDPLGPPGSSLAFRWSCRPLDPRMADLVSACASLRNFASDMVWRGDGLGASGPTLHVGAGQLLVGAYLFSVEVRRRYGAEHEGPKPNASDFAQLLVHVLGGARAPALVDAPWASGGHVSVEAGAAPSVTALVQGSEHYGCGVGAGWVWTLALREENGQGLFPALLNTSTRHSRTGVPTEVSTQDFRRELLVPGQVYSYSLLWAPRWVEVQRLEARRINGAVTLDDISAAKMLVSATSVPFTADGAPSAGRVFTSPTSGEAARTLFTLETDLWSDELPAELEFAFYRLPLQRAWGDGGAVEVEWDNASSSRYWARLDGRLLQPWSTQHAVTGILVPPGDHLLVVRARDSLGAIGTTFAQGPTLSQASSGLSAAEAALALNRAAAASSFDRLLAAADAVSATSAAAGGGSSSVGEGQALTSALLHALGAASSLVAGGSSEGGGGQRLAQVLSSVLRAQPAASDPAAMMRASAVLESCVDALSWDADGISQGAGDAVLDVIAAMEGRLGGEGSHQRRERAEVAQQLLGSAARLGRSSLLALEPLQNQRLRSSGLGGAAGVTLALEAVPLGSAGPAAGGADRNASAETGIRALGLHLPSDAFSPPSGSSSSSSQRRLAAQGGPSATRNGCSSSVGLHRMDWHGGNPHRWAPRDRGRNELVAPDAEVVTLHFWQCDQAVSPRLTPAAPLRLDLAMPAAADPHGASPACLRFDEADEAWTEDGLSVEEDPSGNASHVTCMVARLAPNALGASFVLLPEGLPLPTTQAPPPPPESDLTLAFIGVGCGVALFLCGLLGGYLWHRRRRSRSKVGPSKLADDGDDLKLEQLSKGSPSSTALARRQESTPSRVVAVRERSSPPALEDSNATPQSLRNAASPASSPGDAPDLPLVLAVGNSPHRPRQPARQEFNRDYVDRLMALAETQMAPPRNRFARTYFQDY